MKITKRFMALVVAATMTFCLVGCGNGEAASADGGKKHLTIAYQQGIGYAPIHIMEAKKLIEANYSGEVEVTYQLLASGAAINEGIIGGKIDVGGMGAAPAISGIAADIPYKCIANLTAQPNGLMTDRENITSLKDITPEDKIALINTGSIQHIYLAMACEKYLGDAHALDNNIQPMQHAEGMAALESGTVALHLTSFPFLGQERENAKYHELPEVVEMCPVGNSFLVAMASTKLYEDKELFDAVQKSFVQASEMITSNKDEVADIEVGYLDMDKETVMSYLDNPEVTYDTDLKGIKATMDFMYRAGFITKELTFDDFKFDGVNGD